MKKLVLVAGICVFGAQEAGAETITMICKNPRREYVVVFDSFARSFIAKAAEGDTPYRVEKVRQVGRGYVVDGVTTPAGPAFRAVIDRQKQIQFFVSGKLLQTDHCRA